MSEQQKKDPLVALMERLLGEAAEAFRPVIEVLTLMAESPALVKKIRKALDGGRGLALSAQETRVLALLLKHLQARTDEKGK